MKREWKAQLIVWFLKEITLLKILSDALSLNITVRGCNRLQKTLTNFETRFLYFSVFPTVNSDILLLSFSNISTCVYLQNVLSESAKRLSKEPARNMLKRFYHSEENMATVSEPMCEETGKVSSVTIKEGDQVLLKKGKAVRIFQIRKKRYTWHYDVSVICDTDSMHY